MNVLPKIYFFILASLAVSIGVFTPVMAAGACSPYLGDFTINELFKDKANQKNDVDDFVEVKILNPAITLATYSLWSIQLCENNGPAKKNDNDGCSGPISLADFDDTTTPWLVLKDGNVGSFFNFISGFDAILLDESGDVIDYLSVDGHTEQEVAGCTGAALTYDYQINIPGSGAKIIFRNQDGTGDWDSTSSPAATPTEGSSNNSGGGGAPSLDHFSITPTTINASTCLPNAITIIAENGGNNPIANYTNTIQITVSTSHGNWSVNNADNNLTPVVDNNDDGGVAYTFVATDASEIVLDLSNTHAENLTITVIDAGAGVSSTSAAITFSDNVFTIADNDALVSGDNVPIAGRDHSYQIQMIRRDPVSSCGVATGYSGIKPLKMWRTKNVLDPSPNDPVLAGTSLPEVDPGVDNGNINFINGIADVTLTTSDIGKYTIELADISNTFAGITIVGSSTEQTVRPFGIGIDFNGLRDLDFANNGFIDDSTGSDLSFAAGIAGSIFTQSGEDFPITVKAVLWNIVDDLDNDGVPDPSAYLGNNSSVPSFGLEGETVALNAAVVEPAGATTGVLTVNGTAGGLFNIFTSGSQTAVMTYSNVGIINLNATLTDADYFLSGVNVSGIASNVGRFNPYQYAVTASTVNSACNTVMPFSYARQPFTTNITLQAENKNSVITDGYRGSYATLDIATELNIENSVTNAAYDAESFTVTESFSAGVFGSSQFDVDLTWNMALQSETVSQVNLMGSSDEVTLIAGSPPIFLGSTEVRFGRIALENVFGSELAILTMPMYTEYYDGSNFLLNLDDGCTVVNDADLGVTDILTGGASTTTVVTPIANNGTLNIDIEITPSGAGTGDVVITLDLISLSHPWLQFDWDGDAADDDDPTATATFGIFSGNDVNIYKLQIYQ